MKQGSRLAAPPRLLQLFLRIQLGGLPRRQEKKHVSDHIGSRAAVSHPSSRRPILYVTAWPTWSWLWASTLGSRLWYSTPQRLVLQPSSSWVIQALSFLHGMWNRTYAGWLVKMWDSRDEDQRDDQLSLDLLIDTYLPLLNRTNVPSLGYYLMTRQLDPSAYCWLSFG